MHSFKILSELYLFVCLFFSDYPSLYNSASFYKVSVLVLCQEKGRESECGGVFLKTQ